MTASAPASDAPELCSASDYDMTGATDVHAKSRMLWGVIFYKIDLYPTGGFFFLRVDLRATAWHEIVG